jgi:uncharacterized NAD-dependent epimerase/dehydratase family protein
MMASFPEGDAIVYCEGALGTPNGKTAHGLIRHTRRYRVLSVVDSGHEGNDAGAVLDGIQRDIPVHGTIHEAVEAARSRGVSATHLVVGLAPDGGRLCQKARQDILEAIRLGLNVDSGLHDFLSEDGEISRLADRHGVGLRDVRMPPPRKSLRFFSGKIEQVTSVKVAMLGTDSAVGKRTTAWMLVEALRSAGFSAELIGTGQTAWMQGVRYGIILDALVNDFVAGEIEHAIWTAWSETGADVLVIEGQGSLMNPAYPGGFEIMAAGRPDAVIMQHAPARKEYDGFPGYPVHALEDQIRAVEFLYRKPVVAVTINSENLDSKALPAVCKDIENRTGLPALDVLRNGAGQVVVALRPHLKNCEGVRS